LRLVTPKQPSSRRWRSVTTSKTLPDLIKPFIERGKSGMKAFVVKVKYIANYDEAKKPVVTLQVAKNLLGRAADEGKGSQQGTHLNHPATRAAFEPLSMNVSASA
jgi:hypothetical protein